MTTIKESSVVNTSSSILYICVTGLAAIENCQAVFIYLDVWVQGHKFLAFIDSGASQNFISKDIVEKTGIFVKTVKKKTLHFVDGSTTTLRKKSFVCVNAIGGWSLVDKFLVAPLTFDFIFGMLFLRRFEVTIQVKEKTVILANQNG